MSEGGGEAMASYGTAGYPPPQPATPSSTMPESKTPGPAPGLPPFSSFSAVELAEGLGARLGPSDGYDPTTGRIMDMHWDYNPDGLHRPDLYPTTMIIPQPQSYRPWESKLDGSNSQDSLSKGSFDYPPSPAGSKLPSFQSQFNFPNDQQQPDTVSLTTLTPAAVSPTQSPGLPSFHTLSTVNMAAATAPRGYPTLVPGIQQQFLDDRAGTIHLFQSPQYPPPPPPPHAFTPQNHHHQGTIIQGNFMGAPHHQSTNQATLLTVVKTEPVAIVSAQIPSHVYQNAGGGTYIDSVKMEDTLSPRGLQESRKKERRKVRASSMDSSVESDGVGSSSVESSGQVAAVSSTAGFKSPLVQHNVVGMTGNGGNVNVAGSMMDSDHCENGANGMDKQTKKKRKRCGECIGCQRKDNCGDCAPCRNDKSHQICKMRRCEKLTDKKHLLYLTNESYPRGENRRGRGKGSRAAYRNKGNRSITGNSGTQQQSPGPSTPLNGAPGSPVLSGTVLTTSGNGTGFYGNQTVSIMESDPNGIGFRDNRFGTPATVWHSTDGNALGWTAVTQSPQPQYVGQQIQLEDIRYHSPANTLHYSTHAPPNVYNQPGYQTVSPAQTPTTGFIQVSNGFAQQPTQVSTSSLINGVPNVAPTINGNVEYLESSGRTDFVNGTPNYNHISQTVQEQSPSSQTMDSSNDTSVKVVNSSFSQPGAGNAIPGYPPQQPPQSQQSLHNSNGYPGKNDGNSVGEERSRVSDSPATGVWGQSNNQYDTSSPVPDKNNLNNRIKSMILNKQQYQQQQYLQDRPQDQQQTQQSQHQQYLNDQYQQKEHSSNDQNNHQNIHQQQQQQQQQHQQQQQQQHQQQQQQQQHQQQQQQHQQQQQQQQIQHQQQQQPQHQPQAQHQQAQHQQQTQHQQQAQHQQQTQIQQQSQQQQAQQQAKQQAQQQAQQSAAQHQQYLNDQYQTEQRHSPQDQNNRQQMHHQQQIQQQQMQQQHHQNMQQTHNQIQMHQQHMHRQQIMQQHQALQRQQRNDESGDSKSPRNQNDHQQYLADSKQNLISNNFLVQGHHPRSSATEGGGFYSVVERHPKYQQHHHHLKQQQQQQHEKLDNYYENSLNHHDYTHVKEEFIKVPYEVRLHRLPFGVDPRVSLKNSYVFCGNGGPSPIDVVAGPWCCRMGGTDTPTTKHLSDGCCHGMQPLDNIIDSAEVKQENDLNNSQCLKNLEHKLKTNIKTADPNCNCFPADQAPPEPGPFYTHLGSARSLAELRKNMENMSGIQGKGIRMEKVLYTGKEGKTVQGCPLAKWVIRRSSTEEKLLLVVKNRHGHTCQHSWIVMCIVSWEGILSDEADYLYTMLSHKLNKYGTPTTRRCGTNDPRTCACQGLDPDTCGASFSFGCSWSMYYNGCKFARSKDIRKFKLSVETEEQELEERMHTLATNLSPLYKSLAPQSFNNQIKYDREGSDCRIGFKPGRPFASVTACIDFCAHAHRDSHNMNNGCTVVVTLNKHRGLQKPDDEQLHVLPLYVIDESDEFGDKQAQSDKFKNGSVEMLSKFPCEIRVRSVPLTPCRRKKRKDEESVSPRGAPTPVAKRNQKPHQYNDVQVQSSQISSTVMDSPTINTYQRWNQQGLLGQSPSSNFYNVQEYSPWNNFDNVMSPSMVMEMNAKANLNNYHSSVPNRHHVRNLWPPVGGGLPGGKPVEPALGSAASMSLQMPPDSYGQMSINYTQDRPVPRRQMTDVSINVNNYYYKSSQGQSDAISATTNLGTPLPADYSHYNVQPPPAKYFQHPVAAAAVQAQQYASQFHHADPTAMFNQGMSQYQLPRWDLYGPTPYFPSVVVPEPAPKAAHPMIGQVTDYVENEECFKDPQMGGVAIALSHGSVLFEVAKQELHATTALRKPDRLHPTRISLVFYQHRNLNRPKHGCDEFEEKMRLRKMGSGTNCPSTVATSNTTTTTVTISTAVVNTATATLATTRNAFTAATGGRKSTTVTTTTWTTLFPMFPCVVTGPYQENQCH